MAQLVTSTPLTVIGDALHQADEVHLIKHSH